MSRITLILAILCLLAPFASLFADDSRLADLRKEDEKAINAHQALVGEAKERNWTTPTLLGGRTGYQTEVLNYITEIYEPPLHRAISQALEDSDQPEAARLSATWALNLKGVARQIIGKRLANEKSRLLGAAFEVSSGVPRWVTVEEVQAQLPEDSLLVEFVKFKHSGRDNKPWYAAWAIPSNRVGAGQGSEPEKMPPIILKDLGQADLLEKKAREAYQASANEDVKEKDVLEKLKIVKQALLPFPADLLKQREWWILSPAADIWLVPFEAMPVPDDLDVLIQSGERRPYKGSWYAIEDHSVSYLLSGRDVVLLSAASSPKNQERQTEVFIAGYPRYDTSTQQPKQNGNGRPERDDAWRRSRRENFHLLVSELSSLGLTEQLPGFLNVAKVVREIYNVPEENVLLDKRAMEAAVTQRRRKPPDIIVFSTHGYYLPTIRMQTDSAAGAGSIEKADKAKSANPDPLMRCGLLWTGAANTLNTLTESSIGKDTFMPPQVSLLP